WRISEGEGRGRRPRRRIEPLVQAVFRTARCLRILTRNQIGSLEATEQARVVVVLRDDDWEAALVRADGRHLPSAEEPVSRPALVQILLSFAERQLIYATDIQTMRRLDHRRGELGLEIVVVQRARQPVRVVREVVSLAEHIVLVAAEGVVDVRAPPASDAALEPQHHRIITREPGAHLMRENVGELRERAQQLAARNAVIRSAGFGTWRWQTERPEGWIAKEGIGYLIEKPRPFRQEFPVELIDVDGVRFRAAHREILAARANITRRHDCASRQLVLQISRVLVHIS